MLQFVYILSPVLSGLGVYQLMTTNFEKYFQYTTRQVVPLEDNTSMTMFRAEDTKQIFTCAAQYMQATGTD